MDPGLERSRILARRSWRLPLGDGLVACPRQGTCGVERCLICGDFVGYVDGAVICDPPRPPASPPGTGVRAAP